MPPDQARQIAAIKRRIIPVNQAQEHINILCYGRNGVGKTRFAATAPKALIIDINERGTRSVSDYPGVEVLPVDKWPDIVYAYWFLRSGNHEYESVVIDTITAAQQCAMKHVLREETDRDPHRDPNMPDRRAWGKMTELLKPFILNMRNLPLHVIFVAQERVQRDMDSDSDEGTASEHVPDLNPGTRTTLTGAVDIIGRIYQREVQVVDKKTKKEKAKWEVRMLVGFHSDYTTKDRTGLLGRVVRNPTVPQILKASNNNKES